MASSSKPTTLPLAAVAMALLAASVVVGASVAPRRLLEDGMPAEETPQAAVKSAACCEDLTFPNKKGSPDVCGDSRWAGQDCVTAATYDEATGICGSIGARLCTYEETLNEEAAGTGCFFDYVPVWTSSTCEGGIIRAMGDDGNYPNCVNPLLGSKGAVRCCADVCGETLSKFQN